MSWARLDDRWHDHPKVIAAGLEAAGLWAMCLTWAYQSRRTSPTPGVIPDAVLTRFAGSKAKRLTNRLHTVGLFDDRTEDGWPIHDFVEYLPKYDSEQAKTAGAKGGKVSARKRTAKQTASEPPPETEADSEQTPSTRASARRNPIPIPLPTTSGAEAPPGAVSAQTVTATWVDAIRGTGTQPSRSMIGQASKTAKELLDAGNDPERVMVAARAAGEAGYPTIDRQLAAMNGRRLSSVSSAPRNPNIPEGW